jgi:hypothetical protein
MYIILVAYGLDVSRTCCMQSDKPYLDPCFVLGLKTRVYLLHVHIGSLGHGRLVA